MSVGRMNLFSMLLMAIVVIILATTIIPTVSALPSGAAGCSGGTVAAQGYHTDFGPTSSSQREGGLSNLTFAGTSVLLDVTNVTDGSGVGSVTTPLSLPTQTNLTWTIVNNGPLSMRGILFRVSNSVGGFDVSSGDVRLQRSKFCDDERGNVIGVTHRDRSDKVNVTGTMRFQLAGPASIDVTVVYRNGRVAPGNSSYYAYNNFRINVAGSNGKTVPPVSTQAPVNPADGACDFNGCTSTSGYQGQIMRYDLGQLCWAKCIRSSFVSLRKLTGWKCGTCGKPAYPGT